MRAAFNEVFAWFDPLAPENAEDANMRALGDEVADKLRSKVGNQIDILNVIVPLVNYDQATQDRMNALNVEKPNTRLGGQRAQTDGRGPVQRDFGGVGVQRSDVLASKCLDAPRKSGDRPARLLADDFRDLDLLAKSTHCVRRPLQHRRPAIRLALQPQRRQPTPTRIAA